MAAAAAEAASCAAARGPHLQRADTPAAEAEQRAGLRRLGGARCLTRWSRSSSSIVVGSIAPGTSLGPGLEIVAELRAGATADGPAILTRGAGGLAFNSDPCGKAFAGYLVGFWGEWLGDEGRGDDSPDPARVLRAGPDDQEDRPGAGRLAQRGAGGGWRSIYRFRRPCEARRRRRVAERIAGATVHAVAH